METKQLSTIIKSALPVATYKAKPSELSSVLKKRGELVAQRFGSPQSFLLKVNPDTQIAFAGKPKAAIMGDYPTLRDVDFAYGQSYSVGWLVVQIGDLVDYTGARNLTERQQLSVARVISTEYPYLKVTELLLFFYRFKTGRYGRFYGSVDPMVITCALREFVKERNNMIDSFEREQGSEADSPKEPPMTLDEYLEIRTLERMYEMVIPEKNV